MVARYFEYGPLARSNVVTFMFRFLFSEALVKEEKYHRNISFL